MLQLNPPLPINTPIGSGICHILIDYGPEHDLLWVVTDNKTGEIWSWSNSKVRMLTNISMNAIRKE